MARPGCPASRGDWGWQCLIACSWATSQHATHGGLGMCLVTAALKPGMHDTLALYAHQGSAGHVGSCCTPAKRSMGEVCASSEWRRTGKRHPLLHMADARVLRRELRRPWRRLHHIDVLGGMLLHRAQQLSTLSPIMKPGMSRVGGATQVGTCSGKVGPGVGRRTYQRVAAAGHACARTTGQRRAGGRRDARTCDAWDFGWNLGQWMVNSGGRFRMAG